MIGFDRPVKPEWIFETLKLIEVGENPSIYNQPFEEIAKELVGKEGKRKVRTVIFRSFVFSFQEKRSKIENNIFVEWVHQYSLEQLKPLFLAKILMDYEITRFITRKIELGSDNTNMLSSAILTKRMIQDYGDREVVRRSLRAFLKTLIHFGVLEQVGTREYRLRNKMTLDQNDIKNFILLYSRSYLDSKVVDLNNIERSLLYFFSEMSFEDPAKKYHGIEWEYIRDFNRNQLLMR